MATKKSAAKKANAPTSKSNAKPKSSQTPSSSGVMPSDIQMIALNQLQLSPNNVRTIAASEHNDLELKASIKALGIKQNLVIHKGDQESHFVVAGGRRLKALQTLVQEGAIQPDHLVPCLIEDQDSATLSSATENTQRAAMHPADEFAAFAAMIDEGRSEDEIATSFGVPVGKVRRRLKLARVAPEIFEAYRLGDLTLECVMAFTLTDHHDRQITVWNAIKDQHYHNQHVIKRMLTETSYAASSKLGQFVGIEAYEAAGGVTMRDLFAERETTYFENPELVERLALEKLAEAAKDFEADWKWVDTHLELDHDALRSFGRIAPSELPDDHAVLTEISRLNAREAGLAQLSEERDLSDDEVEEYQSIGKRLAVIEGDIEQAKPFDADDRAIAGVVITIGWNGTLDITKGLVRAEDISVTEGQSSDDDKISNIASPTSSMPEPVSNPAAALRKAEGMPNALADDLRMSRHHILRAHLAADYDVAFDAMLYSMTKKALANCYISGLPLDVTLTQYYASNGEKLVDGSVADRMLVALQEALNLDWIDLEQPSDFKAMCLLSADDKQNLFAWAAASALNAQLSSDNRPSPVIEELGARMDVDVAACWRPTAANYWGSVTKAHIASVAKEIIGDDFADERTSEKKTESAAAMELAFSENAREAAGLEKALAATTARWLPKGMAFEGADIDDVVLDDAGDQAEQPDKALPAFLATDDAA